MRYFDDIRYTCISGLDGVSCAIRAALPCWPFELSPLNVLYRGTLMCSITLVPFEIC